MDYRGMREWDYQHEYQEIRNELLAAMESFQTNLEVHAFARENDRIAEYLTQEHDFRNLQLYRLQTTFFITLARFFDNGPDTYSILSILNMASANPEFFSRAALERRKMVDQRERPPWLDEYLDGKWYPTAADLRELRGSVASHRKQFDAIYGPIRNWRFGHRVPSQGQRVSELFAQALIPEIAAMLHSLYDLLDALQELYYNSTRFQIAQFGTGAKYVEARTRTNTTIRTILSRLAGLNQLTPSDLEYPQLVFSRGYKRKTRCYSL